MPFASGSEVRVAYVAETVMGTIPDNPAFKVARVTSGGLTTEKQTATSDERRADRMTSDVMLLGRDSSGSYDFELSYASFDDWLEAALQGTWTTNVLKNGSTRRSFTLEETLELGATDSYSRFRGAQIDTMSLDITARERVTGSFGFMAVEELLATAPLPVVGAGTGPTYAAPNTNPVLTASAHASGLSLSGMGTIRVRRVGIELTNNMRGRPEVGSIFNNPEFGNGRCDVSGEIEVYFENNTAYQTVLNHGSAALSVTIGHAGGSKYTILLPKIIFGNGSRPIGGTNDDVMLTLPYTAVFDPTEAAQIRVTRAVA